MIGSPPRERQDDVQHIVKLSLRGPELVDGLTGRATWSARIEFVIGRAAMFSRRMPFAHLPSTQTRNIFAGVSGRYAHAARLSVGEIDLAAGAVVASHQHPHDQLSYVVSGEVEFTVGSETQLMKPGAVAIIPGGTPHGCRAITTCRLVDAFTPVREDYR
jgi:quercetin dioxygenase-like cupin family protein